LYDDKWPVPKARSFPIYSFTSSIKPGCPFGPSDTQLMWDQQVAWDQMRTLALQRMLESRDLFIFDGLVDVHGNRYEKRDDQFNIAFPEAGTGKPHHAERLQGAGLDPSFGIVAQYVQGALTEYRGITDIGLVSEVDKGQSGVALAQRNAVGNVPIAHFRRRVNQDLAMGHGVLSDYIHATYTPQRLVRLNIGGIDIMTTQWGKDLPNFDHVVEDSPEFTGLEKTQSEAFKALSDAVTQADTMGIDPAAYIEVFGKITKLPKSVIKDMQELLSTRGPIDPLTGQRMPPGSAPPMGGEVPPTEEDLAGGATSPGIPGEDMASAPIA
jgi:hypothetical protein